MPAETPSRVRRRARLRALILLGAGCWLFLVALVLLVPQVSAASPSNKSATAPGTPTVTDTPTPILPPLLPTNTPVVTAPAATATPSGPKPTATPSGPKPTATATQAPASNGGGSNGGNYGGNGGSDGSGPQPTKVVLSQPTVSDGANSPLQGLTSSGFASNGLLLSTVLGCIVAVLGIITAAVSLFVLLQGGYGPFLRALWLGKRAGKQRETDKNGKRGQPGNARQVAPGAQSSAAPGAGAVGSLWNQEPTPGSGNVNGNSRLANGDSRGKHDDGHNVGSAAGWRNEPRTSSPARSRIPSPSPTRSHQDWR